MSPLPLLSKKGAQPLPPRVKDRLEKDFNLKDTDLKNLQYIDRDQEFAGMPVKLVRIFDLGRAQQKGFQVKAFNDLDKHAECVLYEGRIMDRKDVYLTRTKGKLGIDL